MRRLRPKACPVSGEGHFLYTLPACMDLGNSGKGPGHSRWREPLPGLRSTAAAAGREDTCAQRPQGLGQRPARHLGTGEVSNLGAPLWQDCPGHQGAGRSSGASGSPRVQPQRKSPSPGSAALRRGTGFRLRRIPRARGLWNPLRCNLCH